MRMAWFKKCYITTLAISLAILTSALLGVTVSGTINSFTSGDLISASKINENFVSLRAAIESTNEVPIGTIAAWHKNMTGVPALPAGWVECDGSAVSDPASVLNGQNTPNLNGQRRFLRGNPTSGGMQDDAFQGHRHFRNSFGAKEQALYYGSGSAPGNLNYFTSGFSDWYDNNGGGDPINGIHGTIRVDTETRPTNMYVVWIIRIK